MEKKLEYLRQILYSAIDSGNADEILKASQHLDAEIVRIMRVSLMPNKKIIEVEEKIWKVYRWAKKL